MGAAQAHPHHACPKGRPSAAADKPNPSGKDETPQSLAPPPAALSPPPAATPTPADQTTVGQLVAAQLGACVNGTVIVNMFTLEVAVEDINTPGEQAGLPTAHQLLLEKQGWTRQHCFGAAVQKGQFRPVSGYINGTREGYNEAVKPGYEGECKAFASIASIEAKGLTAEQEEFRKFCKANENREKARIPEEAKRVAIRLASEGGGKETFSIDPLLQADSLYYLADAGLGNVDYFPKNADAQQIRCRFSCRQMLERILQIREQHLGLDHCQVADTLIRLGTVHLSLGEHRKAKQMIERALALLEERFGPHSLVVAQTLAQLGLVHQALKENREAKQVLERSLQLFEPDHPDLVRALTVLAGIHAALGDHRSAKQMFLRALRTAEKHYQPEHPMMAYPLNGLGRAHAALGEYDEAKKRLEWAVAIFEQHGGPGNPDLADTLVVLGTAHAALGESRAAKQVVERALPIYEHHRMADKCALARLGLSAMAQAAAGSAEAAATTRAPAEPPRYAMSRGTAVVVRDLAKRQELNGKSGRITSWSDKTRRYGVELEGDEKPVSVRAANLTQLCGAKVSSIEGRPELDGQGARIMNYRSGTYMVKLSNMISGCDIFHLEASKVILDKGTCVVVQGLSKEEHNGNMGTITDIDSDAMRYTVSCEGGKTIKVKFGNVLC